jgi:hypothetical protein
MSAGQVVRDPQRDRQYTGRLAEAISRAYGRDTILYETHVLAAAMHRRLEAHHPGEDLFRRLLLPSQLRCFDQREVDEELRAMLGELRALAARGEVRLGGQLAEGRPEDVCRAGIHQFSCYHSSRAVAQDGTMLLMEDPKLALFYANRLATYPLSRPAPAAQRAAS